MSVLICKDITLKHKFECIVKVNTSEFIPKKSQSAELSLLVQGTITYFQIINSYSWPWELVRSRINSILMDENNCKYRQL